MMNIFTKMGEASYPRLLKIAILIEEGSE